MDAMIRLSDFMIRLCRLTGVGEGSHDRDMERMQPLAQKATATIAFLDVMRYILKAENFGL